MKDCFKTLRAFTSVDVNFPSILHKKTYFLYFTHSFLQNIHISLSILHLLLFKYYYSHIFLLFTTIYPGPTNFNTHAISDLYLFLFLFHFLLFFFSFSFFLLLHFFFFSVFIFLLLLLKRENSSWVNFFLHFFLVLFQFRFDYLYGFDEFGILI